MRERNNQPEAQYFIPRDKHAGCRLTINVHYTLPHNIDVLTGLGHLSIRVCLLIDIIYVNYIIIIRFLVEAQFSPYLLFVRFYPAAKYTSSDSFVIRQLH